MQKLRQARKLSLRALADGAGVSASTLSRWEAGQRRPSIPELENVLRALGATATERRSVLRSIAAPRALRILRAANPAAQSLYIGGGELLRAMRRRRGVTQAQVARAVGVTQTQIARWENCDAWPEATLLHRLCWELGACADETAILSLWERGDTLDAAFGAVLPSLGAGQDEWRWYLSHLLAEPPPFSVLDITFLAVETRLNMQAVAEPGSTVWAVLLADLDAIHARLYANAEQEQSAGYWANRGLSRVDSTLTSAPPREPSAVPLWLGNVIVAASRTARSGRRAGLRRAARLIEKWLPFSAPAPAYHAWFLSQMAGYLGKMAEHDAANILSLQSCQLAEQAHWKEHELRLRDRVRLLATISPREAFAALEAFRRVPVPVSPNNVLPHCLLEAECLIAVGDRAGARKSLHEAEAARKTLHLTYLDKDLRRIAAQL